MKKESTAIQVAVIGAAVIAGVLLDRLVYPAISRPSTEPRPSAATGKSNAPTIPSAPASASTSISVGAAESSSSSSTATALSEKAALDSILAESDSRQRLRDLYAFINALMPGDYPDAFKRIRQITASNERELASRMLLTQWAQSDPDGALQFAAGNRGFEYVAEDVFQQLAAVDFDSAIARAKGIPGSELRYRALRGSLSFKADTDPRGALELAKTFGDFLGNEPLASAIYRQWAASDPQAAALNAAEGPAAAEGWRSPVNPVVQTWAQHDPLAAAKWSLSLGDAQAQARSVSQVMREWARQDSTAAANWIHALESGPGRDAAVAGLAQALVASDPQAALSWIGTIVDGTTRTTTLRRVSGTVMWRDPENGPRLLEAAGLPADQIRDYRRRGR